MLCEINIPYGPIADLSNSTIYTSLKYTHSGEMKATLKHISHSGNIVEATCNNIPGNENNKISGNNPGAFGKTNGASYGLRDNQTENINLTTITKISDSISLTDIEATSIVMRLRKI